MDSRGITAIYFSCHYLFYDYQNQYFKENILSAITAIPEKNAKSLIFIFNVPKKVVLNSVPQGDLKGLDNV